MQAIPLLFAGGSAAGSGGGEFFGILSALAGGAATIAQSQYQARVAQNNAAIAEQNAAREQQEAAVAAQEGDIAANMEIGQMLAAQGASGLSLGVGSMGLRRKSAEELAAKDRGYMIYSGQTKSAAYKQQAEDERGNARAAKSAGIFGGVTAALGIGESLVSNAANVNARTAKRIKSGGSRNYVSNWSNAYA